MFPSSNNGRLYIVNPFHGKRYDSLAFIIQVLLFLAKITQSIGKISVQTCICSTHFISRAVIFCVNKVFMVIEVSCFIATIPKENGYAGQIKCSHCMDEKSGSGNCVIFF